MTGRRTATPRLCPAFEPDPELGTDWQGRETCRTCQRPGEPGDAGHTPPPPPPAPRPQPDWLAEAARGRDAAVLGEDDREEYR